MENQFVAPPDRPEPTPQEWSVEEKIHILAYEIRRCILNDQLPQAHRKLDAIDQLLRGDVAVPARAHQEEKEQDDHARVDGVPGVGQGDLPRKSQRGEQ